MTTGTKSLLLGVHQIVIHAIVVLLAWRELYGWPNWTELVCIVIHDIGYMGCDKMDDEKGERHPLRGARLALHWFGWDYYRLVCYHSRHLASRSLTEPSKLCWADKLSICYEPWWLYLPRAKLSGELCQYRVEAAKFGLVPAEASNREWFKAMQHKFRKLAIERDPSVHRVTA